MTETTTVKTFEINETFSIDDALFHHFAESVDNPYYDKEKAKTHALENWANLNENTRGLFDHVFGRESRLREIKTTAKWIQKKIAIAEDHHSGFYGEFAGTI